MIRFQKPMLNNSKIATSIAGLLLAAVVLLLSKTCQAQLSGRPVAQPYYDLPTSARFENCRPQPLMWECDPEDDCEGYCGNARAHRPSGWYGIAEFAPLRYDARDDIALSRLGSLPISPTRLHTSDLAQQLDAGGKFTIGRTLGCCYRVEGTYLGSFGWNDTITVADATPNLLGGTGNLSSILGGFTPPGTPGIDFNNGASQSLATSFHSGEINVRGWLDVPPGPFDVSLSIGARYIQINEDFRFTTVASRPLPSGSINDVQVSTRNPLGGPQIGIDFQTMVSRSFYFDFATKGALLFGKQSQETIFTNTDSAAAVTQFNTSGSANRTSFLVDLSLTGNYQITRNWTIRGGYQAIFVDSVALGKDNLETSPILLRTGPGQVRSGDAIYHGPLLGVIWSR